MNKPVCWPMLALALALAVVVLASPCAARAQNQDIDVCIDASEQAVAFQQAAKLIDERKALARCTVSSCPEPVLTSCRARMSEVNRAIPTILLVAKDRRGRDVPSVSVRIDGALSAERLDGGAIALDPGDHEFRFEVPGAQPVIEHFVLHESEQGRRETVLLDGRVDADVGAATAGTHATSRAGALVVGGVGVAGLLTGAIFSALSLAAHDAYERDCGQAIGAPAGRCNVDAVPGESDAATKGTVATAFLIGGGAVTALGAVWFLVQGSSHTSSGAHVGMRPHGGVFEVEF